MEEKHTVYLSLGSNLGNREEQLGLALELLGKNAGTLTAVSEVYETAPWPPGTRQPPFLNQAAALRTGLSPEALLERILLIEKTLGRVREQRWAPRTIDIDILFYDDCVMASEKLVLPHPYIAERAFVLEPLREIAPDFRHPQNGATVTELLDRLLEQSKPA